MHPLCTVLRGEFQKFVKPSSLHLARRSVSSADPFTNDAGSRTSTNRKARRGSDTMAHGYGPVCASAYRTVNKHIQVPGGGDGRGDGRGGFGEIAHALPALRSRVFSNAEKKSGPSVSATVDSPFATGTLAPCRPQKQVPPTLSQLTLLN